MRRRRRWGLAGLRQGKGGGSETVGYLVRHHDRAVVFAGEGAELVA